MSNYEPNFNQQNGGLKSPPPGEIRQGHVSQAKQRFEGSYESSQQFQGQTSENLSSFEAERILQEAQRAKEEARKQFEQAEEEFRRATQAQEEAARAAEIANQITLQALNKEVEGQEKLVQAGHKLMEAGAKLQQEASQIGRERQAMINIHQKGKVRQEVQIEAPIVPPPSELHVLQSRSAVQCIPIQQTEEKTVQMQFQQTGPQPSF